MQDINNHADRSLVPPKSTEMVVHYVDSTGKKRVKGGADMIASQSYPRSSFSNSSNKFCFLLTQGRSEPTRHPKRKIGLNCFKSFFHIYP